MSLLYFKKCSSVTFLYILFYSRSALSDENKQRDERYAKAKKPFERIKILTQELISECPTEPESTSVAGDMDPLNVSGDGKYILNVYIFVSSHLSLHF